MEGEENRASDRYHESTVVKDFLGEGDGADKKARGTQEVTGRPRDERISKRKMLRNVHVFHRGQG